MACGCWDSPNSCNVCSTLDKVETKPDLSFNEYQRLAFTTAMYPEKGTGSLLALCYIGLGLSSESGEVGGKVKKFIRGDFGKELTPELKEILIKECSDVLWYLASMCTELGTDLKTVAEINLEKLFDRKERGVIQGSGDNR